MHLKSLILKGFKSFADKTGMSLEPGVTVVVGPNGSGKSNISDAVLWVLGEQSAKQLRGQAMEDVIFAGSSARQAVGIAEVDLVLDNSDHTLPLEFHEVTITRRMFRNGESEYLINQSPARLMDVQDLLHDTGLGRDTHSIISQGRLDEVLNSRAEERRQLIEEAAGVLKHKKRKERALRKLSAMDAHLERAKDISSEIDRQLRPLQRQASKASQHAELTSELRELDVALAVDDMRALQTAWDQIAKREKEADADIELSRLRLSEKERELAKFQALLEEKGLFVGDLGEQRRRMQSILERLDAGLLLLEEKGKNLVDRLSDLRAKLYHSETRAAARRSELERLTGERTETDARLKALYAQLSEVRKESEAVRKARMSADDDLGSITANIRRVRKQLEDDRADLAKATQALSALTLEAELLAERLEGVKDQTQAAQTTLSARRGRLDQAEAQLARARKEQALADSDVDRRVRVLESRRKDLTEHREALTTSRAEAKGLEEVDRAFAAASPALAWALSHEKDLPGMLGPVAEAVHAPEQYEVLVERLLGADLFGLVVADRHAAARIAERMTAEAEGEISLVPVDGARTRLHGVPATGRPLLPELACEESVRHAVEALLGDVYVVDTIEEALAAAEADPTGARFATPEGAVVWPNGKLTLGAQVDKTEGVLTRKRRINELHDDVLALSARVGDAEAATAEAEEALSAAQQDALEISQKLAALTGERDSLLEETGRLEQALTTLAGEMESVTVRITEIDARKTREAPSLDMVAARIEAGERELEEFEERSAIARENRDSKFREESATSERLSTCQVEIATVSEREVHLKRQVTAITNELAELEDTVRASRETESALEVLRERIQPVHDMYSALQERAEHWAVKLRDRARFEQADSDSLRETIHGAQDAVKEAQTEIDEKLETMTDLRVEKGQLEIQVSQAARRIVEELGVPLESALSTEPLEDRATASERAHKIRKQISNLGPVNPIAMEEFQSLQSRRDFMNEQIEDLESSRKALHKVVAAIDRKMRDRFIETFELVDEAFREIFGVLFPGGHAELTLTDPEDPEATGVEVVAQPRGKKLSKMSLMSGGEKSLTALALLFAVYRTRPCPFYILDEVEAALDDTNLRRFVAFVDSMRNRTQFIVVTHQRRTMEMADVLYGVSMQADGVSKVVSQKLDRASASAETETDEHAVV
ncbi:MAG: chromosome segregation protein SMC [Coriobacteriales bacterium]|nr:chromosome segregation protein SMC [Coriobacteriales bacterium]